jgi:hypothetical protein
MTALDKFQPVGKPIHPYDLFELIDAGGFTDPSWKQSPAAVDIADYERNLHKIGTNIKVGGVEYFETATVKPVTTRFV